MIRILPSVLPMLLLVSACSDGGEGGGGEGPDGSGGSAEEVVYPEINPNSPSCGLVGEVSGGDTRTLDGNGCSGFENDININGGGFRLLFNVETSFSPVQVGEVPLEEVRYGAELNLDAPYVYFSASVDSCLLTITSAELQGGAIPSLEGAYILAGTGKCDAPLLPEEGDLEPVTLSPFAFRAIYRGD